MDAVGAWLTPSTLLLALASGQLVLLNLEVSTGSVRRMGLQKANDAPRPSCACRLGHSWLFLGSWVGDSLLLHASPDGQKVGPAGRRDLPRSRDARSLTAVLRSTEVAATTGRS